MATIPVLVDDAAGITLPESTTTVEYLDGVGDAPRLVPADPAAALQARLWDRVLDGHVMTPMQKIVIDSLRPEGRGDPEGVVDARARLDRAYDLLDDHLSDGGWVAGPEFHVGRLRRGAGALLRTRRTPLGRAASRPPDALLRRGGHSHRCGRGSGAGRRETQ